jgi:hypothetical protein
MRAGDDPIASHVRLNLTRCRRVSSKFGPLSIIFLSWRGKQKQTH